MIPRPRPATAIPADSWPRCWSANKPKYAWRATSCPGARCRRRRTRREGHRDDDSRQHACPAGSSLAAGLDPFGEPRVPRGAQLGNSSSSRPSMASVSPPTSPITTKPASASVGPETIKARPAPPRTGRARGAGGPTRRDRRRRTTLPERPRHRPRRCRGRCGMPRIGRGADPPCTTRSAGRRPWADHPLAPPAQLGELGAHKRWRDRPDERDRVSLARRTPSARRGPRRAARRPSRPPASGRSARWAPRCRARRCRRRPGRRAPRRPRASPSTASVSCQATCGFSGFPKFRQFVRPSGSAPTQARLAAHSYTASAAPRRGSHATRRPLPSIETAIAGVAPRAQREHGRIGLSGRRTVRDWTIGSYCSNTGRREARFAERSSASSVSAGDSSPVSTASGAPYSRSMAVRAGGRTADNHRREP